MTKEDILYRFKDINLYYNDCTAYDNLSRMLDELISEIKGKWTPISEKPPEIHQDVLLFLRSLDIERGFRGKTEPYYYSYEENCYIEPQNVLAWMPLPEPYKEDED